MSNGNLLSSLDKKAVSEFRGDLLQMLRIAKEMDRYLAEGHPDLDNYIKKSKALVGKFNKKYKNLKLKLEKKQRSIELRIFISEKNVKEAFANSASKILGVQSIGTRGFKGVSVANPEEFSSTLEKAKNMLCITYHNPQSGSSSLFLQCTKKSRKVQLVYDFEEIQNEPSAEFQMAAYYALSKGYSKRIKLGKEAAALGFYEIPHASLRVKYHEKFDPHLSE